MSCDGRRVASVSKGGTSRPEVILWALRRYLTLPVSYCDFAAMLPDQGAIVDHTTLFRWVQIYANALEWQGGRHLRPCTGS